MLSEEQKETIKEATKESINGWAKKMFCGPVLIELINAQTDLTYITMPEISEADRGAVRRLVKEHVKKELLKVFSELGTSGDI